MRQVDRTTGAKRRIGRRMIALASCRVNSVVGVTMPSPLDLCADRTSWRGRRARA